MTFISFSTLFIQTQAYTGRKFALKEPMSSFRGCKIITQCDGSSNVNVDAGDQKSLFELREGDLHVFNIL